MSDLRLGILLDEYTTSQLLEVADAVQMTPFALLHEMINTIYTAHLASHSSGTKDTDG